MTVSDVLAQVIWVAGTLALVAIIGAASYVITKLGELVAGRRVEVDAMFYLFGAAIGMVLLPSHAFASAATRVALVLALSSGALFGGVIGLLFDIYWNRQPMPSDEGRPVQSQHGAVRALSIAGTVLLFGVMLLCGALFLAIRFREMPFFGPLIQMVLSLIGS